MRGLDSASSKKQTNMHGAWKRVYVDPSEVQRNASESDVALCEKDNPTATVGHIVPRCDRKKEAKSKKIKISTESKMKNDAVRSDDTIKGAKRKTESKAKGATKQAKKAKGKDPNAPKRPASGFLIFMETFRKTYKEANPESKGVAAAAKAGGEKWKQMSEEEKAPYNKDAGARKATYEQALTKYRNGDSSKDDGGEVSEAAAEDEEEVEEE
ncbi:hypothetical protein M758_6G120000 [Ceratodon purpureus]|uniref:HMG box domain-containing protein n=1 Tax=Ceratodon purpureus TaxID=3225 RepID=A0A8T0HG13_CERPU|nr:hypothetical protein KC19_6G124700 [Ceratodon purpureus]KAG0569909.1 hypothetical protein KC19_6G124700 [Ceratodon purpureus]KAG0569911.1 hypothetical protein KC19_6G124700 [Ceratodon purpureus]KAG0569913.1 hypothetical protein KC19_6G124700 [Ceratodon purpureus]KAG0613660.1 hypothetical protein M758_6G120000 [Ceratodon purpureus]